MRAFLVLLAAAGVTLSAQPPQDRPKEQPVFRSGVDLVRFDVRVTDDTGRPVTDLRPEEVQIVEDGGVRPLLLFQHIEEPAGTYREAALRAVSAEVSSNQGTPRGHLYILVFDQHHIAPGNEQVARRAAEAFINTRLRPSDRVAVFGLPGPGPQLGFTADRGRAVAELTEVYGSLERNATTPVGRISIHEAYELAAGNDRVAADVLARQSADFTADVGSSQTVAGAQLVDRGSQRVTEDPSVTRKIIQENARTVVSHADADARQFLQRLSDLIEQYRTIEGRKTVILFSEGFHNQNVTRELEQVAASAAQSYAVVYAFDLNRRRSDLDQQQVPATDVAAEILARTEPLGSLAAETDGVLIHDASTHLDQALNRLADQSQDYYLVGFAPSDRALASRGQYRRVSVRVTRPGTHVSARTGYAMPRDATPIDRRRAIDAALAAPFAQQALRIGYTTYALGSDTPGRTRIVLALEADLPVRDAAHDSADVVFVVRGERDGHVAASGTDSMPLPAAATAGAATGVSKYHVQFELQPGAYLMRTVVREPGGLVGSADRRLEVRPFSGPDVSISDLVLGSTAGALPVRAEAYTATGLSGVLEAYGRTSDQLSHLAIRASVVSHGSESPVATAVAELTPPEPSGGGFFQRATFSMPLSSVAPGTYVVKVNVRSGNEPLADLEREVDVLAGSSPAVTTNAGTPAPNARDILNGDFVKRASDEMRRSTAPSAVHATKGFDLFAREEYRAAAEELSAALKLDQTTAATAFVLGWAYENSGDNRQAIGAWRAAAAIDPKMVPAHLALADAYLKIDQPALAAQALRAGLAALPDSVELHAKLEQIERRQ